jgi:uncharacterized surface protein with fasciclin (FAS1) repeats
MKIVPLAVAVLTATLVLITPAASSDEKDVLDSAIGLKNHTILVTAFREAELAEMLRDKGPHTVFAPTDAAFRKLGDDEVRALIKDKERLRKLVLNHIADGRLLSADLMKPEPKTVKTLGGSVYKCGFKNGVFDVFGDAIVTKPDIKCTNGVIHAIDTVLMPK